MTPRKKLFKNIVGKGENAVYLMKDRNCHFGKSILLSANPFHMVLSKNLLLGTVNPLLHKYSF